MTPSDKDRERGPWERLWLERVASGAHFSAEGDDLWRLEHKAIVERLARMKKQKEQRASEASRGAEDA